MANMFMTIGDLNSKGDATAAYTGGDSPKADGWFAINSINWGAARSVGMDIGNGMNRDSGMDIGNGMNRDSGMVAMFEVSVSKEMDGASENILSLLYVPGDEGDKVTIIVTKPDRKGQGSVIYLTITMEHARIVNYSVSATDGSTPYENIALAYSKITFKHWHEAEGGKMEAGGDVSYDLPTGKSESHSVKG